VPKSGVVFIGLDDAEEADLWVLPAGRNALHLLAGFIVVGSSLWRFGAFDRPS